jgi:hypothetical protein
MPATKKQISEPAVAFKPAEGVESELEILTYRGGGLAQATGGYLDVLFANGRYDFSSELNADDQMQILAMCQGRPGTVANEHADGLFYSRLRQSLIDSKGRDAFFISNASVADVFSNAHIKVNILRGQTIVPRFQ